MKTSVLLRKIHHWGSIVISIPLIVIIGAGLMLQLKKEIGWIQPPTQQGVTTDVPALTMQEMFDVVTAIPEMDVTVWEDLERVDFKPDKGIVKFVSATRWEVQMDPATGEVLQLAYRRSDLIESIHDGSFFAGWTKHYLFFPAAIVLFVLWVTGLYMFFLPYFKKAQKKRRRG